MVVVTIIAGATISTLSGDNGIFKETEDAKKDKTKSEEKELLEWASSQAVQESEIGIIESDNLEKYINTYIGKAKEKSNFDYEITKYDGIFVVKFKTSGNEYTIADNGIVYDGEQPERQGIEIPDSLTVNVGESVKLNYKNTVSTEVKTTWASTNSNIAKVDQEGNVTGVSNGTATISVTTEKGKDAECLVTVQTVPRTVTIEPSEFTIDISSEDRTKQLVATVEPATANAKTGITWATSDSSVLTVDSTGKVTAVGNGTATVTATTENGITGTCTVTVVTSATGLNLNYSAATLDITADPTLQLTATSVPDMANVSNTVTWSSAKTNVATVDSTGKVTAVGLENGKPTVVEITATTDKGITATCKIVVVKTISSITIDKSSGTIDLSDSNKTLQLTGSWEPTDTTESVTWTSSNTSVATVSQTGLVTGKANGTVTITLKSSSGKKSATCTITVQTSPTSVAINPSSIALDLSGINGNKTGKLTATVYPSTANVNTGITWSSDNTGVVTVDSSGNLTAKGIGATKITAIAQNGKTAQCSVVVTKSITSLAVSPTSGTIDLATSNTTLQLTATINPSDTTESIIWTSSNTNVAIVGSNGLVTGKGLGTTTITVSSSSGKVSAYVTITVKSSISAYISLASKTTTSIKVNASGGNTGTSYTYQISTDNNTWTTKTSNTTNSSYTYSGLLNYTTYYVRVVTTDSVGNTKTSSVLNVRTYCPGTTYTCNGPFSETVTCSNCNGTGYITTTKGWWWSITRLFECI